MRTHSRFLSALMLTTIAVLLAGCAGKTVVESDLGMSHAPDWVNEGTQYLNDKDGRLFHGVGEAPPMGDVSLQKSTADNRARAEVARILGSWFEIAGHDYSAATGTGKDAVNQQSVSRDIKNLTRMNLSGARIIGRWKDEKTGIIYSLAELDMKYVKEVMATVKNMNPDLQDYLRRNADNLFDKIAK